MTPSTPMPDTMKGREHTPTPWRVQFDGGRLRIMADFPHYRARLIAELNRASYGDTRAQANAALIVQRRQRA